MWKRYARLGTCRMSWSGARYRGSIQSGDIQSFIYVQHEGMRAGDYLHSPLQLSHFTSSSSPLLGPRERNIRRFAKFVFCNWKPKGVLPLWCEKNVFDETCLNEQRVSYCRTESGWWPCDSVSKISIRWKHFHGNDKVCTVVNLVVLLKNLCSRMSLNWLKKSFRFSTPV